jgi:hypothetical protein
MGSVDHGLELARRLKSKGVDPSVTLEVLSACLEYTAKQLQDLVRQMSADLLQPEQRDEG